MKKYIDFLTLGYLSAAVKMFDLLVKGPGIKGHYLTKTPKRRIIVGRPVIMKGKKGGKNARRPKI
jgi:hypothetical protein